MGLGDNELGDNGVGDNGVGDRPLGDNDTESFYLPKIERNTAIITIFLSTVVVL